MKTSDIILDRTFDASCMTRAGENEWAEKILTRLKVNHPELKEHIERTYEGYLSLPMAEYIQYRMDYMLEHKDTIRLRYR